MGGRSEAELPAFLQVHVLGVQVQGDRGAGALASVSGRKTRSRLESEFFVFTKSPKRKKKKRKYFFKQNDCDQEVSRKRNLKNSNSFMQHLLLVVAVLFKKNVCLLKGLSEQFIIY